MNNKLKLNNSFFWAAFSAFHSRFFCSAEAPQKRAPFKSGCNINNNLKTIHRTHFLKYILVFTLFILSNIIKTQNIKEIISYKKTNNGIQGIINSNQNTIFEISVYSENVIRVQISKNNKIDDFSYALEFNNKPNFKDFKIVENQNQIKIYTNKINLEIDKIPYFRLIFKDNLGNIINEDMPGKGMGYTFIGDKITVYKKLQENEKFVGMGESLGDLNRANSIVTTWNTDYYKYDDPRIPMYISVPFYMGIFKDKLYGIYYDNSHKGTFNFGTSNTRFSSVSFDGGDMDYFFIYDDSLPKILNHYSKLTGKMPLPPKWSIGYHQSRCNYYNEEQVNFIAETFRSKKIPLDCIVLDADYLVDYEPFRIDSKKFPDMKKLAQKLKNQGIELTASVNPGIKIDSTYSAYNDGLKKDVFLKYTDGELYKTEIAPNMNYYPDFTNPKSRNWWADQMKIYQDVGINGYWNDMNEPAINGQSMPDNVVFDYDSRKSTQLESHNLFGFLMARSSFESFKKYGGNNRPFVMTRSAFAGIQRYAIVWSGDNQAKDEHILLGVLLNNQMGLSGIPFVGPDLGGYIGDGNKDLYKRWIQVGVFSPYLRNHREQFAAANEPWAYGEENEAISKTYINFRYQLLPYVYSKFYEASQTGLPISKSLCLDFPFDEKVYQIPYQTEFFFGDALFIVPLISKEKKKKIYFPNSDFYNIFTDEKITGNQELTLEFENFNLPIYVKESSIIPMQSLVQSSKELPQETLFLHIYNGKKNNSFIFYEDDGQTLNYKKGDFNKRNIEFNPEKKEIFISKQEGNFGSHFKKIQFIFHGFELQIKPKYKEKELLMNIQKIKLIDPLENMDQIYYDRENLKTLRKNDEIKSQIVFEIINSNQEIKINW